MVLLSTGQILLKLPILTATVTPVYMLPYFTKGTPWRKRPLDVQSLDPFDKIQVGHVYAMDGTTQLVPGVDTRQGPIENWNGGRSGYYLRKFVDPTLDPQYVNQDIPFRHIRYAEVLLNYAEACH